MKHRRLLRPACAACLLVCASFAYHAAAATFLGLSARKHDAKTPAPRRRTLLHGKQLVTLAGYELNATFTPDGKFYCFEVKQSGV